MALFIPSKMPDQHFGQVLNFDDLIVSWCGLHPPMMSPTCRRYKRMAPQSTPIPNRPDAGSQISLDRHSFQVCVDVQQFSPEEISVKAVGEEIIVEGKHEEKKDEYGSIFRHFLRRYTLPEGHKSEDVVSSLSPESILTITAPRKHVSASEERVVPITFTGIPRQVAVGPSEQTPPEPTTDAASS